MPPTGVLRAGYVDQGDSDALAYTVRCRACAAEGGWTKSPTSAATSWNLRTALGAVEGDTGIRAVAEQIADAIWPPSQERIENILRECGAFHHAVGGKPVAWMVRWSEYPSEYDALFKTRRGAEEYADPSARIVPLYRAADLPPRAQEGERIEGFAWDDNEEWILSPKGAGPRDARPATLIIHTERPASPEPQEPT
jgi:hypothetical protein